MKLSDLLTTLSKEPYCLWCDPMTLTMEQIALVLRDPKEIAESRPPVDFAAYHRNWAMMDRVPEGLADKLWRERGG